LWEALHGETDADEDIHSKKVVDDVFLTDSSTYISVTSHSGEIASILRGWSIQLPLTHSAKEGGEGGASFSLLT
jgi:hypothetical protein